MNSKTCYRKENEVWIAELDQFGLNNSISTVYDSLYFIQPLMMGESPKPDWNTCWLRQIKSVISSSMYEYVTYVA